MFGLSPEQLEIVKAILSRYIPDREVAVFGSRAMGSPKPFSDLDLCIMGETSLPKDLLLDLEEAFLESDLPMKVDVVNWADLNELFRRQIQTELMML